MSYQTKAEQKRELDQISKEYEKTTQKIQQHMLENRSSFENLESPKWDKNNNNLFESLYYCPHNITGFNQKKIELFKPHFPEETEKIEALIAIRKSIKETEIKPIEKETPAEVKVLKTIKEIMETRKVSFIKGLELVNIFGKLNVSTNVHQVINQHGTVFPRCFFYLNGQMTALSTILAIAEETKK